MKYPAIAARIYCQPLLIARGKAAIIIRALEKELGRVRIEDQSLLFEMEAFEYDEKTGRKRFPLQIHEGIAVVDVFGTLVQKHHGLNAFSGMSSYERIAAEMEQAADDPKVRGIVMNIDSPGGEVSGSMDAADVIYRLRGRKPIHAFANDFCCSGAYLLACQADKVYASQTAMTGSIGVVVAHVDVTERNRMDGVLITEIFAGDKKVDFSPFQELDEKRRASLQEQVDTYYQLFVDKTIRGRGISGETVRGTQAGIFIGAKARGPNLIDGIRRPDEVLAELHGGDNAPGLFLMGGQLMKKNTPQIGETLSNGLEETIQEKVDGGDGSREEWINRMAEGASMSVEEVELVMSGETSCPTIETLTSFEETLDKPANSCREWAEADGCTYETEETEETGEADADTDAEAKTEKDEEPETKAAAADASKRVMLEVDPAVERFLLVNDAAPSLMADLLTEVSPKTVAELTARSLTRIQEIRGAALHGQEELAEKLAGDPTVSVMEAKSIMLDAEKTRRKSHLKAMTADDSEIADLEIQTRSGDMGADHDPDPAPSEGGGKVHLMKKELDELIDKRWDQVPAHREEFPTKGAFAAYARRDPSILKKAKG